MHSAGHHANTHLALTVGGAARAAVTGDAAYARGVAFFAEALRKGHSYSTGGSNYREYWATAHQQGSALFSTSDRFAGHDNEESCTTFNFLKILRTLFSWTGRPEHAQMYSHAVTNGVLGIQGASPGVMIYLLPLGAGVTKGNSSRGWGTPFDSFWCCYGTAIESFSKLADGTYYAGDAELFVARYVSSIASRKGALQVAQRSSMALHQRATITVTGGAEGVSSLLLRVPPWAGAGSAVTVNGVPTAAPPVAGQFHRIRRRWAMGDAVEVHFPCKPTLVPLDDARPSFEGLYSFEFGDTVLVGLENEPGANNSLVVPSTSPASAWVRRTSSTRLRFDAHTRDRVLHLMPLNEVVDERYTVYYRLEVIPVGGSRSA